MSLIKNHKRIVMAEHPAVRDLERRHFLRQSLSLGALTLLTGCDVTDHDAVDGVLRSISRWNDRVQAWLFHPDKLAPTFAESQIDHNFRFNAFYPESKAPVIDGATWRLRLVGKIADKRPWTLAQLTAMPQESQITRHVCVEGWSKIGKWGGVPLGRFLRQVGADTSAKYVGFTCADGYSSSMDMATALHPQTIMALTFADQTLPRKFGYPMKIRVPTKLGFKNPKFIVAISVRDDNPGGYWEDRGYNWFSGI